MLIINGIHKFRPRTVAFRLDYCRSCKDVRTQLRVRTVDFLHVYWIPLLPLGFWKRWKCGTCGEPPYRPTQTSLVAKLLLMGICLVVAGMFWFDVQSFGEADSEYLLELRLAFTLAALVSSLWVLRHKPDLSRKQGSALVPRGPVRTCLVCGGPMQRGTPDHCQTCNRQHLPVPRED